MSDGYHQCRGTAGVAGDAMVCQLVGGAQTESGYLVGTACDVDGAYVGRACFLQVEDIVGSPISYLGAIKSSTTSNIKYPVSGVKYLVETHS